MKVMQINSDYAYESTGKITECLHLGLLERGVDSIVCYGRDNGITNDRIFPVTTYYESVVNHALALLSGRKYSWCWNSTNKLISLIKREKPDIVHLQCINGYFVNIPRILSWLAENEYNVVLTLHAEFMYTGGCDHAFDCDNWKRGCIECRRTPKLGIIPCPQKSSCILQLQQRAFSEFRTEQLTIISVSEWMKSRAVQSPLLERFSHRVIFNSVDTSVFYRRNDMKLDDRIHTKYCFFATTYFYPDDPTDNKGSYYLVQIAQRMLQENRDITFVVASNYTNATELPSNIVFLDRVVDQNLLANYYSSAICTLSLSKRESFGMTIAESLCCGTYVLGFCSGGPETIATPGGAEFVPYGNYDAILQKIVSLSKDSSKLSDSNRRNIEISAQNVYDKNVIVGEHVALYEEFEG